MAYGRALVEHGGAERRSTQIPFRIPWHRSAHPRGEGGIRSVEGCPIHTARRAREESVPVLKRCLAKRDVEWQTALPRPNLSCAGAHLEAGTVLQRTHLQALEQVLLICKVHADRVSFLLRGFTRANVCVASRRDLLPSFMDHALARGLLATVFEYLAYSHADVANASCVSRKLRDEHVGATPFLWGIPWPPCCFGRASLCTGRRRLCAWVEGLLPSSAWLEELENDDASAGVERPESLSSCPVLIAGSHALHLLLSSSEQHGTAVHARVSSRLPFWQPNDMDVWLLNRWDPRALASWLAERIQEALGLAVSVGAPEQSSAAYIDAYDDAPETTPWNTYVYALEQARPGRCAVTLLRDLFLRAPCGRVVLKVSLIGTRAAAPTVRTCLQSVLGNPNLVPPLEPEEVLQRFDFDVCQVGYLRRSSPWTEAPRFIYADQDAFREALQQGRARSTVPSGSHQAPFRFVGRRRKYERRGLRFEDSDTGDPATATHSAPHESLAGA